LMAYLIDQITQEVDTFKYVKNIPEFGEASYPTKTITTLFEQQVLLVPKKIALKYGDMQYTFEELNKAANRVAHALINEYGIKVGDKIPLILTKSEKMIIAILGVLKAGAVYVPMSPTFPKERITYIQKQVEASLTIDDKFMAKDFSIHDDNLDIEVRPESLAYIIFTSGTTGRPKGVMVEHRNFICYLGNILASIKNTGTQDIEFGCIAEYVFDIFGTEIFGQLLRGKPINLFTGTPEEFPDFMKTHYVTTLQSTPGKISYLFQDNDKEILGTNLSTILVGGEKMNDSFADRFRSINLINIYGPTEGTVWTSMKRIEKNYSNIGTPFPNYAHFILDEEMRLIPDGAIGELYVGGPQLSRGYYGQPELTNNSFLKNPYNYVGSTEYSRIYKTGDVVRRLLNHEFELIGRNDFQVKIRGFRIELGEIESAMLRVPGIKQVLALALGEPENKYLGVYYKSDEEIKKSIIEEVISQYLTDYMMP
ncbi:MAG: amino acid adenylation domain-containing protein, partial [Enterococcus sp.]|nr:amino acid adenylation domain-containing protein [Enterococcus sp.]